MKRLLTAAVFLLLGINIFAQAKFDETFLRSFEFRNFGAHRVGAWLSSIAVPEKQNDQFK